MLRPDSPLARELRKKGEMHGRLLVHRRNAHEALDRELQVVAAKRDEGLRFTRHDPGLLRLLAGIDLNEEFEAAALLRHFIGDGARDLLAVDAVNCIEEGNRFLCLVGLQWADQMQFYVGEFGSQRRPFALGFLHAIFAEYFLPCRNDGTDRIGVESFGNGNQLDAVRVTTGGLRGGSDFFVYAL